MNDTCAHQPYRPECLLNFTVIVFEYIVAAQSYKIWVYILRPRAMMWRHAHATISWGLATQPTSFDKDITTAVTSGSVERCNINLMVLKIVCLFVSDRYRILLRKPLRKTGSSPVAVMAQETVWWVLYFRIFSKTCIHFLTTCCCKERATSHSTAMATKRNLECLSWLQ